MKVLIDYLENVPSFENLPGGIRKHLEAHESELKGRAAYKRGNCDWWRYTWPLHKEFNDRPRILCPYLAANNRFALDLKKEFIGLTDTTVLFENRQPESLLYLLGLLNSKLLTFRFMSIGKLKSGGILEFFWNSISKIPIRRIKCSNPAEKDRHDQIVSLVDLMIALHTQLVAAKSEAQKEVIQRQISATDAEIDRLVYDLYGLTEEEIAIVESND